MAMGTRARRQKQQPLWIASADVVQAPSNIFYDRVSQILEASGFDGKAEAACVPFYKDSPYGRPSITPGVYFRLLLIGYFEGLGSEREIAWRVADSLSLRRFVGFALDERTPDHSTISRTRRLYNEAAHKAVFGWVLEELKKARLVEGKTIAIDATTLEANAAMKSIVRRDNGQGYNDYLKQLAAAEGIEHATRQQVARMDRKRKKKGSNEEWMSPADPDARITKMKDGRTHLAHKAEHAVDLLNGALLSVTLEPANAGDTTTVHNSLREADAAALMVDSRGVEEVVADKGYHSGAVLQSLHVAGIRSYLPEPKRGRRKWVGREFEQRRTYENRRRVNGDRGKRLQKMRSEMVERSFAHMYETGAMRRVHLRGSENILKRLLLHGAAFNLALLLRKELGAGKPRQLRGRAESLHRAAEKLLWWAIRVALATDSVPSAVRPPGNDSLLTPNRESRCFRQRR